MPHPVRLAQTAMTGFLDGSIVTDGDAETEGMIGYLLEQVLGKYLPPDRAMATILSQIVVDEADPAFQNPTKFIGPVYSKDEAEKLGLPVRRDGEHFRRVVPSPLPVKLIDPQMRAIKIF